jgi:hypothetical protein
MIVNIPWRDYDRLELGECGITEYQLEQAKPIMHKSFMSVLQNSGPIRENNLDDHFASLRIALVENFLNRTAEAVSKHDHEFMSNADQVQHAFNHMAAYLRAEFAYKFCAERYEAAVKELIGE